MVNSNRKIVVDNVAKASFKEIYQFIKKDSIQNAEKVKVKIFAAINNLGKNPERYNPDKYRLENDGSYRAFELYKIRVSYFVSEKEIRVIRIRHTKMNPQVY